MSGNMEPDSPKHGTVSNKDEPIVYRYSRDRRIERADPSVRWLASQYGSKGPGLFRRLTETRSSRLMLVAIGIIAVAFYLAPFFSGPRSAGKLGNERYSVKAVYFEGRTLVILSRQGPISSGEGLGAVRSIRIIASQDDGTTTNNEIPVGAAAVEDFRMALESSRTKNSRLKLVIEAEAGRLELETAID
jgi:hypothetical protein